ncbi:MAG TPA: ABC transporter permease [Chitinophagaceae bacterium]
MNYLSLHNKAFKAEWLKLRHSGMVWLLLGATAFIPVINLTVGLLRDTGEGGEGTNIWNLIIQNNFMSFTGFFFPMFLLLMVARLVYLEHRSDTWKLLETQPVPRFVIYFAKWEVAVLISLLSLLGLLLFALLDGAVLMMFRKDYALNQYSPDMTLALQAVGRYWVASLGIISLQYFLGLMIRTFAWPLGIGLIALIAGGIFAGFGVAPWFPYAAPAYTSASYEGSMTGKLLLHHEQMSLLWAVLFLWMGYQFFVRKSFTHAFVLPLRHGITTAVVLGLFVALAWGVNRPEVLDRYGRTVLAGQIRGTQKVGSIALLSAPANDTLLVLPVRNGKFHAVIPQPLDAGVYTVRAGKFTMPVYMSTSDSTYLDWELKDKMSDVKATGTRVAENAYLKERRPYRSWALTENAYQYPPKVYASRMISEWEKESGKIRKFKTVDNIRPADDFLEVQQKLLAVQFLDLADNYYPQVHAVYFPNETLAWPASLDNLRKEVSLEDSSLITYSNYRAYVTGHFRTKSHKNDSLFFYYLDTEIKNPRVKDFLMYEAMQNNLGRIKDSARRDHLLHTVLPTFSSTRLKDHLSQAALRMSNMQRGRTAYNFTAEALNGRQIQLANLAGRYIVVDVWATWCGPCKKENPVFDELAERYTSERLAFVSVSVDEDANQWRMQAAGRSKKVLQLHATDEEFSRRYALNTIPRFMLIDPRGNIIDADMPHPTEPEFEAMLEKEVGRL